MPSFPGRFKPLWWAVDHADTYPILAISITDLGADEGIDVAIHVDHSDEPVFETILADPESRVLLTNGSLETEAIWRCVRRIVSIDRVQKIFVTARCRSSLLGMAISTRRMGYAERRNARFLRLIEDILDEFQTREPGLLVEVAVTHRNPKFDHYLNY